MVTRNSPRRVEVIARAWGYKHLRKTAKNEDANETPSQASQVSLSMSNNCGSKRFDHTVGSDAGHEGTYMM